MTEGRKWEIADCCVPTSKIGQFFVVNQKMNIETCRFLNNRMVAAPLAQRSLRPGPRVGTDGLGQNKMPGRQDSIRGRAFSSSVCVKK